jgi:acetyltransferase-like isoleucine patch superfamily enzyme
LELGSSRRRGIFMVEKQVQVADLSEFQVELLRSKKTPLMLYQDFFVGKRGIFELLKYELICVYCNQIPGALGILLREKLYPRVFKKMGHNVILGKIVVRHPYKIELGNNVVIDDYSILDAHGENNKGICLKDNVMIGRNTLLHGQGYLEFGLNSKVNINCFIQSENLVKIGENVNIGAFSYLIGQGKHNYDRFDIPLLAQKRRSKEGIVIEDDVIIGTDVKILDGVKIGTGCLIGAGAVVTKDIPSYSIAVGIPATVIKKRK